MRCKIVYRILITLVFLLFNFNGVFANNNPFQSSSNLMVQPSPLTPKDFQLNKNEQLLDFAVHPNKPIVALLIKKVTGQKKIIFWKLDDISSKSQQWDIPKTILPIALKWHPLGNTLFLLVKTQNNYQILKTSADHWQPSTIFNSNQPILRMVIAPRPFKVGFKQQDPIINYRVFFGLKKLNGKMVTYSITENGDYKYSVLDAQKQPSTLDYSKPHTLTADSALPIGFHPVGNVLLWQDSNQCFHKAIYGRDNWEKISEFAMDKPCFGDLSYTPNGSGLLHWKNADTKIEVINDDPHLALLLKDYRFASLPQWTADASGIVALTKDNIIKYIPIHSPLSDVTNAWMFIESPQDRELFIKNSGLFRPVNKDNVQLYQIYDSENYLTDASYDSSSISRPYLVTTDIFWELYSSAFEGIFIVSERQAAIPLFWNFVQKANASLQQIAPQSKMAQAFAAILAIKNDNQKNNLETTQILNAKGIAISNVTHQNFDFGDLKPRGHYTLDNSLQEYFKASKYLMSLPLKKDDISLLQQLPKSVMQSALAWIKVYEPFIALSNAPLIWDKSYPRAPSLHPQDDPQVFPLSWGIDNEIFNNTVFHPNWPSSQQVCGPKFCRVLPSGLDIATVLGSNMAQTILQQSGEFSKYPPLANQIVRLKEFLKAHSLVANSGTLYQRWIESLAVQWSNTLSSPQNIISNNLWQRKRLQTGLASWATLRHATLLVNARSSAEAGEGGYEELIMEPPRGYVEPDPKTFNAVADLFDATIHSINSNNNLWSNTLGNDLKNGIVGRLKESRDQIRAFSDIAAKEIAGLALTPEDYQRILYVGRAAEHNFLVFKSLAQKNYALSTPDPCAKIADVAASNKLSSNDKQFLLVAVGYPLEWDQIVPFYGRKEIVKGAIYSYYEMHANNVMSDEEWRKIALSQPHPDWIAPYVANKPLSVPVKSP